MIDARITDETLEDLRPVIVMSPTGMLVGIYWGSRFEICEAIDEVTDPNECTYRACGPGGIRLGCFHGEQELSISAYNKACELAPDDESLELRFEGTSDSGLDWMEAADSGWLPIVPPGYRYMAGSGLTRTDTEWN